MDPWRALGTGRCSSRRRPLDNTLPNIAKNAKHTIVKIVAVYLVPYSTTLGEGIAHSKGPTLEERVQQ